MEDYVIEDRFSDLNERINRIDGLVTIILDTLGKQTSDIGLLKSSVESINSTVCNELMGDKIYAKICEVHGKPKTVDKESKGDLLSRLNSKDKMDD